MPNNYTLRKATKRMIGGYFDNEIKSIVRDIAILEGKNEKELLQEFIGEGIDRRLKKCTKKRTS